MRQPGRRPLMCLVLLLLGLCLPGADAQTAYNTVVVFGDSLSDTGNIANLTQSQFKIRYPADNQVLGFDYTDGRFTDGVDTQPAASTAYTGVWVEQLAGLFGGKVTIKDSLDGGTDYAYGDATTADGTTTESKSFLGQTLSITLNNMGQQVTSYLATNPTPNSSTLYVLWGGANDLLNAAEAGQDPVAAAQTAVSNELALIQRLRAAGATDFLIPNLPPLGAFAASYGPTAVAALNNASGAFAQGLTAGLNDLKQSSMGATLNLYQPDVFTLFQTVAANPMAVGIGNVTSAAQNITVSPDTYLIWDGLHPTTTGHHLVAATAAATLSPLATSSTTATFASAGLPGGTVALSAAVTSSRSGTVPSGLVTFFNGASVVGSAALDATGKASTNLVLTAGTTYSISAVYAGDVVNSPSAAAPQSLATLSAAIGTSTTLSSSGSSANLGAAVTLTATVTPAVQTYGLPTGTVTFSDGTTALGTGTLTNGTATLTISSLAAGTHSLTATYAASGLFGGSTSAALNESITAPGFTPVSNPTTLSFASGSSGTVSLNATSLGGYTGTLTLSCGTLPSHFACSFSPASVTATDPTSNAISASTLSISTNTPDTAALFAPERPGAAHAARVVTATLGIPGLLSLVLLNVNRRRRGLRTPGLSLLTSVLGLGLLTGLVGCGSGNNNAPAGTYTVPVIFTASASNGVTPAAQTINITVNLN